jgi:hypothetical protein
MGTIATVAGHVRVISTFSYVGSHTAYLTFNAFLSAGVLLAGLRFRRRDLLILGGLLLGATVIVLPMAGSRGPIVIVAGALVVLLSVAESRYSTSLRFAAVVLILGIATIQLTGLAEGWEALAERATEAGDTEDRFESVFLSPFYGLERGGLLGYGAGGAHQAAARFVPGSFSNDWLPQGYIESPSARVIIELGAIGWLILLALKTAFFYLAYRTIRQAQHPVEVMVGVTAFCVILSKLPFTVVFNAVSSAFFWGSVGAMLGVWSLQQVRSQSYVTQRRHAAEGIAG